MNRERVLEYCLTDLNQRRIKFENELFIEKNERQRNWLKLLLKEIDEVREYLKENLK
jgi:hypothetical protein